MVRALLAPETFNLGETTRAVEVALAMRALGHDVLVAGYSRRFSDVVTGAGLPLTLLDPELSDADADLLLAADQGRALRHPFTTDMVRERVAAETALLRDWRADVAVIGTTLTQFISARAARVPLAYVKPHAMSSGHLSTLESLPLTAGRGPAGRTVNRAAASMARGVAGKVRWLPTSCRLVAAEYGVRLPARTIDALDADLNLLASLFPALDGRPVGRSEIAVGPIYAGSARVARADEAAALPDPVRRLAARARPAVYVGLGSSGNREIALRVLRQVARLRVDVITTAGRFLDGGDRAGLPGNVAVYDHLPAARLAGLIDASVIHGGEGTVQTAISAGVPFAGIGLQMEQRMNLDECVAYGNALRFTPADLRRGAVTGMVDRLLRDPGMAHAAARLRDEAAALDGAGTAARLIAELATAGWPPGRGRL